MSFWYLSTPYRKYPLGRIDAFRMASMAAAKLLGAGVPVFSPIAHSHPIATWGCIDPGDHDLWMRANAPFMEAARGGIVWEALGWRESRGVAHEIDAFARMGKPIVHVRPVRPFKLPPELLEGIAL